MKNKKRVISVIIAIAILLVVVRTVLAVTGISNNIKEEKAQVVEEQTESKASEIVLENNKYMHVETDASGDEVPVPNGFVGSKAAGENEIDTGFVIYEGEEEVTDSNVQTAQTSRNQYVWIPVEDISKFYGTDANGKSCTFDEVTGTYAYDWSETNGVMSISSSTSYREPDVVVRGSSSTTTTGYDMDSRLRTLGLGAETTHEFLMQLEKEFNKMIDSVEKYGGFYIGRYETGNLNQEVAVVQKGNTNIASVDWYTMYKKCKTLSDNNSNIETGMIWGNQWDRTLMWLMECNAKDETTGKSKEEVIDDSSSWGNYRNATFTYTNSSGVTATKNENSKTRIPTGSTEYTKANNIYDLAGNVEEWTMEASATDCRVLRGGSYGYDGDDEPASYRVSSGPTYSDYSYGCRAALYIK